MAKESEKIKIEKVIKEGDAAAEARAAKIAKLEEDFKSIKTGTKAEEGGVVEKEELENQKEDAKNKIAEKLATAITEGNLLKFMDLLTEVKSDKIRKQFEKLGTEKFGEGLEGLLTKEMIEYRMIVAKQKPIQARLTEIDIEKDLIKKRLAALRAVGTTA